MTRTHPSVTAIAGVLATSLSLCAGTATAEWDLEDLGTIGGTQPGAEARAVSSDGSIVVGDATDSNGRTRAFWWSAETGMIELAPHGDDDEANGVSGDGTVVVGLARFDGPPWFEAWRWTAREQYEVLEGPGVAPWCAAWDASADGTIVVGEASSEAIGPRAIAWSEDDLGALLPTLGDPAGIATAISADGRIAAGILRPASGDGFRIVRWIDGAGPEDLGTIGAFGLPFVQDLSGDGSVIVGRFIDDPATSGFRWTEAAGLEPFGPTAQSVVNGVSADGTVIVGQSYADDGSRTAWVWTEAAEFATLPGLGGTRANATAISDDGRTIVGSATTEDGIVHAVAWRRTQCPADLDADGTVGIGDLVLVLAGWETPAGDVDGDGQTDLVDLLTVLALWGAC